MKNIKMRELILKAEQSQPIVNVGKSGVTENLISEIQMHAKKRKVFKVKVRRNILQNKSRFEVFSDIASRTGLEVVKITGNTAIFLYKGKKYQRS
ncbi:MAG: YhbY family RNA-binding protein [Promethearchaeota archaeon]